MSNYFGAVVQGVRAAKGLDQTYIARHLGRTQGWVSRVESGRIEVRVNSMPEWARALGTDVRTLNALLDAAIGGFLPQMLAHMASEHGAEQTHADAG